MKKSDVEIGQVYVVKVSNNLVPVRIDRESPYGGWDGTNLVTKRSIRIRSARRLRRQAPTAWVKFLHGHPYLCPGLRKQQD